MITDANKSAIALQLDAVELMIARDVNQGRALSSAHATLTHIAQALGLAAPADYEMLKASVASTVARANAFRTVIAALGLEGDADPITSALEWVGGSLARLAEIDATPATTRKGSRR